MAEAAKKVLLVDDDTFLLDMYSLKFGKSGYEVKTADSGEAGLKVLRDGYEATVVLIDIIMPVMDGLQLVANIRKENLCPQAAIIMLTNQGASEDIARSKKLGVDGYIVKATTIPSEVLGEVEKIVATKKGK